MNKPLAFLAAASLFLPALQAGDWPMWGGTPSRNMVAVASGIPDDIHSGKFIPKTETIDPKTTKNVKWVAKLGSQTYGTPVVAGGRVFVGTNNESPRDGAQQGDRVGQLIENGGFPAIAGSEFGEGGAQRMGAERPKADPGGAEQPGGEEGKAVRQGHAPTFAQRKTETSAMVPAGPGFPTPAGGERVIHNPKQGLTVHS